MQAGKRHGWGAEIPILNHEESTSKIRRNYFGIWKQNKRVINPEVASDPGFEFRKNQKQLHDQ
jgi:hypothetical protein